MDKPDFNSINKELNEELVKLRHNFRLGESGIVFAISRMISVMEWTSSQQDTNNIQIANLTDEIKVLHLNLKKYSVEANNEAYWMKIMTIVMVVIAVLQLFITIFQYKLGESQINWSQEQLASQNAALFYQQLHDERMEKRDIKWRKEDLESQGRLP